MRPTAPAEPATSEQIADRWPLRDRRAGGDRRHRPTRVWDSFRGPSRRRGGRRAGEQGEVYVDRYRRREVLLVIAILLLNVLDAVCTLAWLGRGGSEGNPLMIWVLELGDGMFLFQKCVVAGVWLIVLLVHKNFRMAWLGLWALLAVYGLLAIYHGVLIAFAEPV